METVFDAIQPRLAQCFDLTVRRSSQFSSGVLPRVRAVLEARREQGEVTHVVGDVHYLTLLLRRPSTVLTIHDIEFLDRSSGLRQAAYRWLWVRLPAARAALITTPSEAVRAEVLHETGRAPDSVVVVPNPVRPGFSPSPLPAGRPVVLLMGAWPNKNLDRSLAALAGLDVAVRLVGSPSLPQARALAEIGGTVARELSDEQVTAEYAAATLLLFPSTSEGFGVPVLEAQASGRPVVTSDLEPLRTVAGGAALLVDPLDVAAIRAGVEQLLGDPALREQLVRAGLANAAAYSPDSIADRYAEVYRQLLTLPRRSARRPRGPRRRT